MLARRKQTPESCRMVTIETLTDLDLLKRVRGMLTSHNCKRVTINRGGLTLTVTDSPGDRRRLGRRIGALEGRR